MANQKPMFCKHGNVYVLPNVYNEYTKDTLKCKYYQDKTRSVCQKCCMVLNPSRTR